MEISTGKYLAPVATGRLLKYRDRSERRRMMTIMILLPLIRLSLGLKAT